MVTSKIFKIIFALFVLFINIMEIWSCTGLGGYTGLGGLPFNPSILQNPDLPRMIQTMPPQQIVQLLPLYGSLANQYPQYIPLIIGMLTPDQRYALASSPLILPTLMVDLKFMVRSLDFLKYPNILKAKAFFNLSLKVKAFCNLSLSPFKDNLQKSTRNIFKESEAY
ncbi:unnamed protein product [Meloidogyne enterolobii]|uniref:Uncharacterized protein n=1 Tax=Meloidogyne enterolobii TaxID=390850 RepID=A0ACB1ABZ5_MELEN